MSEEIPLRCYFAATKSTRGQMASAVTVHAATRPRALATFGAVYVVVLVALVALHDGADRVPRGLGLALAITVVAALAEAARAWVAAYRSLGDIAAPATRSQSGFADGRVRLHTDGSDEVHAYGDLAALDVRGRFALLRTRADGQRWFVYPRALFPDAEVARIREAIARTASTPAASAAPRTAARPTSRAARPTAALDLPVVAPAPRPGVAPTPTPEVRAPAPYRGTPPPAAPVDAGASDIRARAVARDKKAIAPPLPDVVEPTEELPLGAPPPTEPPVELPEAPAVPLPVIASGFEISDLTDLPGPTDLDDLDDLEAEAEAEAEEPTDPEPDPVVEPILEDAPDLSPDLSPEITSEITTEPPHPAAPPPASTGQRYVATPGTAGRLAHGALSVRLRQQGIAVAASLTWATATAVVATVVGGPAGARVAVGAAAGLLVTVAVLGAWIGSALARLNAAAAAIAPAGATLEVELGQSAVRIRTPLDDLTVQHRGLAAVHVSGDVVVLRGRGGTLDLALPRELFPEEGLTRLRAVVRRS